MTHICIEMPKIPNLFAFTSATNQWSLKCFLALIKGEETCQPSDFFFNYQTVPKCWLNSQKPMFTIFYIFLRYIAH